MKKAGNSLFHYFYIMKSKLLLLFLFLPFIALSQAHPDKPYLSIPVIDLDKEISRQVVVDREEGQYLGHTTTALLDDGKTILIVYPKGHGRGEIIYKKSFNGGITWTGRLSVPESWKTSKEVPTLFMVTDPQGKKRIIMFSGLYPARMAVSEDEGGTWSELNMAGDWGGIVVMGTMVPLKTGKGHYLALFHDDLRFFTSEGQAKYNEDIKANPQRLFTLYKTFSYDGALNWSFPEPVLSRRDINLCEPGAIRSPNGKQIAVLLRENARRENSQIIFSSDEGKTWSEPRALPYELNGDRHVLKYTPDGRILAVFRDVNPASYTGDTGSPTAGDWVGWVGTWKDLTGGKPGQYRIRFKDNTDSWDCCYPGVELLPDGTFVVTTYGHWEKDKEPYILSIRFKTDELDSRLKRK
jgi:hypothetical protein